MSKSTYLFRFLPAAALLLCGCPGSDHLSAPGRVVASLPRNDGPPSVVFANRSDGNEWRREAIYDRRALSGIAKGTSLLRKIASSPRNDGWLICNDVVASLPRNDVSSPRNDGRWHRDRIKEIYTAEIGTREKTGKNDGKRVEEYLAYTGLGAGEPWCAAFVCWVYGRAGLKNPRSAWSPNLFPPARVVWKRTGRLVPQVAEPAIKQFKDLSIEKSRKKYQPFSPGNIFGIWYATKGRIAHTGFIDHAEGSWVITVEGNTSTSGGREGDGVYRKRRLLQSLYQIADWITPAGQEQN